MHKQKMFFGVDKRLLIISGLCNFAWTLDDVGDVFFGQRFKVQHVGGVKVGGDRLGVVVGDDGLIPQLFQGPHRVDAAVVKLDALPDANGTGADDQYLFVFAGPRKMCIRDRYTSKRRGLYDLFGQGNQGRPLGPGESVGDGARRHGKVRCREGVAGAAGAV